MHTAAAASTRSYPPATTPPSEISTLAQEHAHILRDVQRRVAPALALLDTRSWPHDELRTLTGFLRTAVLRQASDEEALLYPTGADAPFAELTAEHVELYTLTEQLDQAESASCSAAELRELLHQVLRVLEHHLIQEQALLAALPDVRDSVPATADLITGARTWGVPDDEPVVILLDALPEQRAVQICLERLLRLRPGQSAEIHSTRAGDVRRVGQWIRDFDSTRYGMARLPSDLPQPVLHITCRRAA